MPLALLVNPSSAGGQTLKLLPRVEQALDARRIVFRVERTRGLEHGVERALRAVEAGEVPVVMSGDGLIGAVGGALAGSETPLGIVPGGRGNDLARVLGIPDDPEGAVEMLAAGQTRRIDVGEVNGKRFLGIVSVGFDSEANRLANETKFLHGNLVYAYGGAAHAARPGSRSASPIRVDDERVRFTGYSVSVANSQAYGGGMFIAPDADLADGEFDIVTVGEVGKLRFLGNLPKVFKGTHVEEDEVRVFRAPHLELSASRPFPVYADGEHLTDLPVSLRVLPRALSVLVPPGLGSEHGALFGAKSPRARAIGAASRASGRGGGTTLPGRVLLRLAPDAIARLGAGLDRGATIVSATNGKTTTAGMIAAVLGADGRAARPQPGRLEHDLGGRHGAARAARPRGPVRGRRGLAAAGERAARPLADRPRQPLPRPARPLRRDRGAGRASGRRRSTGGPAAPASCSTPTTR